MIFVFSSSFYLFFVVKKTNKFVRCLPWIQFLSFEDLVSLKLKKNGQVNMPRD